MLRHSMRRWYLNGKAFCQAALLLSMMFALLFSLAPFAHAQDTDEDDGHDSHARIVRLSYVEGEVRLDNGHGYESATMNVPVTERNWLQTGSDGWAEVQFEDGSLIRLAPDTVIAFTELSRLSSGGTVTTIDLDQGEAEFKVTKHDGSDFQVTVKKNTIALVHSGLFRVTSTSANPMEIAVSKGEVAVRDGESDGEVAVKKNETFALDPNDLARYALDKGTESDDLDRWSQQRDDALSAYASSGQGYIQSPYQYGASDLNYYGQYYDVPGYGNVWQPYGVNYGWDPFSNGYWSYSPGFGYTWVSSYPWGWMPYRYGRWVFINGRGWCWAPGGWNRWYSRPRWVNAPPGFHAPSPPAGRRVVGGAPGQNNRPGTPVGNGGNGRFGDRDGDNRNPNRNQGNRNPGPTDANRGGRRVLTNDDVQAKVPRTDIPAQSPTPATIDIDRTPRTDVGRAPATDNHPAPITVEQQPARNPGGRDTDRFRGDREPPREPVRRSNNESAPPPSRPERQYNPPPQSYSPPARQVERQYTPPPQPVQQSAPPPPPPAVHQSAPPPAAAPVQRQASPPPESHVRSSDDGSHGRPK
jgi:hypothetical protein